MEELDRKARFAGAILGPVDASAQLPVIARLALDVFGQSYVCWHGEPLIRLEPGWDPIIGPIRPKSAAGDGRHPAPISNRTPASLGWISGAR